MRNLFMAALGVVVSLAGPSTAHELATDAELHAGPNARTETLVVLAAGSAVALEDAHAGWIKVAAGGWEGWVRAKTIALENPYCDLGYPYSGSARYFEDLTAVRTSNPLGFLLGHHVARPC